MTFSKGTVIFVTTRSFLQGHAMTSRHLRKFDVNTVKTLVELVHQTDGCEDMTETEISGTWINSVPLTLTQR